MHIHPIPAFEDNYIWLLVDGNHAAVIDPGQADPVIDYLENHQLKLKAILLTHHHYDHIDGAQTLRERYPCPVYGPKMHEIDTLAQSEGDSIDLSSDGLGRWQVIATPGHTLDHLAYFSPSSPPVLFCGDTLFGAGCGKLFEGTAEQMQSSLEKIRALPDDTLIYCGHEYTEDNLRFATLAEPDNRAIHQRIASSRAQRARNEPTLPSTLALEKATNPFLRWDDAELLAQAEQHVRHNLDSPASVFAAVRAWKDAFDSQSQ
ncbi:MAG TPA: hydroxyacylglutathione hydrolase [bacterium]|nr:hydroxyacylglutathione hydrolase [bacterium]